MWQLATPIHFYEGREAHDQDFTTLQFVQNYVHGHMVHTHMLSLPMLLK